jgi:hypothetical protein
MHTYSFSHPHIRPAHNLTFPQATSAHQVGPATSGSKWARICRLICNKHFWQQVGAARIGRLVCARMSAAGKQCCCSAATSCNSNTIYAFLSHTSLQIRTPLSCEQRPSAARPTSSASSGFGSGCKKKSIQIKTYIYIYTSTSSAFGSDFHAYTCTYKDTYNIHTCNIHTYKYIDTHATYKRYI